MNLYIRYFDKETLVTNVDDAIAFLRNIDEIGMNPVLEAEIREYVSSEVFYPKRYKVRPRIYFIIIKTDASTMADFKEKRAVSLKRCSHQQSVLYLPSSPNSMSSCMDGMKGASTSNVCLLCRERVSFNIATVISWHVSRHSRDRIVTIVSSTICASMWTIAVSSLLSKVRISNISFLDSVNKPHNL